MPRTPSTMLPLGSPAPDFRLPQPATGRLASLADFAAAPALLGMFICNHCPYAKHIRARLAACTPDFFLFDQARRLVYRGQFDDSRPRVEHPLPITAKDLCEAMDAVLSGRAVSDAQKPSLGCNIKWKPGNEPNHFNLG